MINRSSFQHYKSQNKTEQDSFPSSHFDRDSLVDPHSTNYNNVPVTGYARNTYIEPAFSTFKTKPVSYNTELFNEYAEYSQAYHSSSDNLKISNENSGSIPPTPSHLSSPVSPFNNNIPFRQSNDAYSQESVDELESLTQEGITLHEQGKLEEAVKNFRLAAQKKHTAGMFFYGMSLRHGWGCKKNEHMGFQYIQRVAEYAIEDLKNNINTSASKYELILAIYELGNSHLHAMGCKKNKKYAVEYFRIAANLGDPDAQNELGKCYESGVGVKKDKYMSAKYYRKAHNQGQGIMGTSWIWKPKYDQPPPSKK